MAASSLTLRPGRFLSFSQIDLWLTCARKYYFERVQGMRSPPSHHLEVGNAYHEAIAGLVPGPLETGVRDLAAPAVEKRKPGLEQMGVDTAALLEEMVTNLGRLQATIFSPDGFRPATTAGQPIVEHKFFSDSLRFTGVIDAVSTRTPVVDERGKVKGWKDGICVLDWKTLSSKRRRSARDAQTSEQLGLYGLVLPLATAAAFVEIPRDVAEPIQVRVAEFEPAYMARVKIWLERIRDHIYAAGEQEVLYPPTQLSNGLCSPMWCAHYDRCYPYNGPRPTSDVEGLGAKEGL